MRGKDLERRRKGGGVCGICGLQFASDEDFEKHIFHYGKDRWCGVAVLRAIESDEELARLVHEKRKSLGVMEGELRVRRDG